MLWINVDPMIPVDWKERTICWMFNPININDQLYKGPNYNIGGYWLTFISICGAVATALCSVLSCWPDPYHVWPAEMSEWRREGLGLTCHSGPPSGRDNRIAIRSLPLTPHKGQVLGKFDSFTPPLLRKWSCLISHLETLFSFKSLMTTTP